MTAELSVAKRAERQPADELAVTPARRCSNKPPATSCRKPYGSLPNYPWPTISKGGPMAMSRNLPRWRDAARPHYIG